MESKNAELVEAESRMVVSRGWARMQGRDGGGGMENGEMLVKGSKVSVMQGKFWRYITAR